MISEKMKESINEQINKELYSSYLYLGMASCMASIGLKGISHWFMVQVQEEIAHAQILYNYVNQQNERVMLKAIDEPPQDFPSAIDAFSKTLEHEKKVTGLINNLVNIAAEEKDHATGIFLQWFVTEQVEEESNAGEILQKLKLVGTEGNGLLMIDNELGQRIFNPPQQLASKQ